MSARARATRGANPTLRARAKGGNAGRPAQRAQRSPLPARHRPSKPAARHGSVRLGDASIDGEREVRVPADLPSRRRSARSWCAWQVRMKVGLYADCRRAVEAGPQGLAIDGAADLEGAWDRAGAGTVGQHAVVEVPEDSLGGDCGRRLLHGRGMDQSGAHQIPGVLRDRRTYEESGDRGDRTSPDRAVAAAGGAQPDR